MRLKGSTMVKVQKYVRRPRGFTLIELTVVLLILVALAGVLIPLVSGYLGKAAGASSANNIAESVENIQLYQTQTQKFPDGYTSLVTAAGTIPTTAFNGIPGAVQAGAWNVNTGQAYWTAAYGVNPPVVVTPTPLASFQVTSMQLAGINNIYEAIDNPVGSPTTYGVETSTLAPLAADKFLKLDDLAVKTALGIDPAVTGLQYFVFAISDKCSAIGKTMVQPPVAFVKGDDVTSTYCRFFAVYGLPSSTPPFPIPAKFISVLNADLTPASASLQTYYTASN